jgi:hypothetical protein
MKPSKKPQDLLIDQITSKITRFNMMKSLYFTATLTFALLLISACSVNGFQVPGVIPTETTIPTLTATPIPTATPDPFEDFAGKDCTNWEEPCPAKYSDWKSGLLLAYAKTIATPFSEEVMNIEFKMGRRGPNGGYPCYSWEQTFPDGKKEYFFNVISEVSPFKFVAHFIIPDAPMKLFSKDPILYFDIAQYKNADGSSGYLTFYTTDYERGWGDMLFNKMGYTMPMNVKAVLPKNGIFPAKGENIIGDAQYWQVDENEALINEWIKTGVIPKELENRVLAPWIRDESCYKKIEK